MKQKIYVLLMLALLFTGCSTVAHLQTDDVTTQYPKTNPSDIDVFSVSKIGKNYLVLGKVIASADAGSNAEEAVSYLKTEASVLGADAIIDLKLEIGYGYWSNAVKASGTAIKYINK